MSGPPAAPWIAALAAVLAPGAAAQEGPRTVRARVQPRPGAEVAELDMPVHAVPVDPPLVGASDVELDEGELVLGFVRSGQALAVPIRTLSAFEVLNTRLGDLPVAPTW